MLSLTCKYITLGIVMLSFLLLSVASKDIMLGVVMLSVIKLSAIMLNVIYDECHYVE